MHLYFDESGDFAFPTDRYDVYVQAGLIVPDSFVGKAEHYVANKKSELAVKELHAAELPDEELAAICEWLNSGPLSLVGQATDTAVMTAAQLRDYRKEQAARVSRQPVRIWSRLWSCMEPFMELSEQLVLQIAATEHPAAAMEVQKDTGRVPLRGEHAQADRAGAPGDLHVPGLRQEHRRRHRPSSLVGGRARCCRRTRLGRRRVRQAPLERRR
jgi:hypothetical protein